ncbi:hypothetical protein [Marivita geojedonensis]|uniref:Uncharacterized protein n=1 Tax=Marivita geojedonensis TaxID=1123756 RepID=A0A1X4N866_9RHOB|nr:hypothetical protein [Marivita geojedonensis]OSQ42450.1 hypothetical protein MGEO_20550 [Marivita geojedonensis]
MKKPLLVLTAALVFASSPFALKAEEAEPEQQLILPLLLEDQAEKKRPKSKYTPAPSESFGDNCDYQPLNS